jgi:hypothetical protein
VSGHQHQPAASVARASGHAAAPASRPGRPGARGVGAHRVHHHPPGQRRGHQRRARAHLRQRRPLPPAAAGRSRHAEDAHVRVFEDGQAAAPASPRRVARGGAKAASQQSAQPSRCSAPVTATQSASASTARGKSGSGARSAAVGASPTAAPPAGTTPWRHAGRPPPTSPRTGNADHRQGAGGQRQRAKRSGAKLHRDGFGKHGWSDTISRSRGRDSFRSRRCLCVKPPSCVGPQAPSPGPGERGPGLGASPLPGATAAGSRRTPRPSGTGRCAPWHGGTRPVQPLQHAGPVQFPTRSTYTAPDGSAATRTSPALALALPGVCTARVRVPVTKSSR